MNFAINRASIRELAVACSGCNISHSDGGALYIYEADPKAKSWTATAALTTTDDLSLLGQPTLTLGGSPFSNGVGVAIDRNHIIAAATQNSVVASVVFGKERGKYSQQQTLTFGADDVFAMDVYDETVVLGTPLTAGTTSTQTVTTGQLGIFYPSTDRYKLSPKGKPKPVQWSLQQVLVTPDIGDVDPEFGYAVKIEKNRLIAGARNVKNAFVYERESLHGKWSLQQMLTVNAVLDRVDLHGSTFITDTENGVFYFDETERWDCLLVSVEDHFHDGWDSAELTVDVPGGDKDFFSSRCDLENPFQFRYCPADVDDEGLYKFSIPDGKKAKFHWELLWRVYEESTGTWFTGNWDTKMDFEWDSDKRQFNHKKIEHELPNNITCKECPQKPTSKPSSRLRKLHSKDHTQSPTLSPAPTMSTTNYDYPWQELKLKTAGEDWFDAQHKGTSYYISDKHGHRLLSTGTMCPWETNPDTKTCWEDYPDGEYILRVGGALDRVQTATRCRSAADSAPNDETSAMRPLNS